MQNFELFDGCIVSLGGFDMQSFPSGCNNAFLKDNLDIIGDRAYIEKHELCKDDHLHTAHRCLA